MSIKSKFLAVAATLALVGGVGLAGALTAGTASAAMPSCRGSCVDILGHQFGTHHDPVAVVDMLGQGEKLGQPIILFRPANLDLAEDSTTAFQGIVADFHTTKLVSAAMNLHYGADAAGFPDNAAFEINYAPFGGDSGLCAGVTKTAYSGEGKMLLPCGVSADTVSIASTHDRPATLFTRYATLINGPDTNFSAPFALTDPANGYLADVPQPQLQFGTRYATLINGPDTNFSAPFALTDPANGYLADVPQPQLQFGNITGNQALKPGRIA